MALRMLSQSCIGSSVNARLPSPVQKGAARQASRQMVKVKAETTSKVDAVNAAASASAVEDVLNKASQLLAEVENDVLSRPVQALQDDEESGYICDESGCSVRTAKKDNGTNASPLRSIRGNSWSVDVLSEVKSEYGVALSGSDWTVNITTKELEDLLEAIAALRNVVNNKLSQGQWHATLQPKAQWRVNNVQVAATYAEDPSGQGAFDLSVMLGIKGERPVEVRLDAAAVLSLMAAVAPMVAQAKRT